MDNNNSKNNNKHKKFDEEGTHPTSPKIEAALDLIYKNLDKINFRLRRHPNYQELIKELNNADSSKCTNRKEDNEELPRHIERQLTDINVRERDYNLIGTLEIIEKAKTVGHPIGSQHGSIFIYTGTHWNKYDPALFRRFLEKCYLRLGVPMTTAKRSAFLKQGQDQFEESALIKKKERPGSYINLENGVLTFGKNGVPKLEPHDPEDFITYVLPYSYDKNAKYPKFQEYLDYVVPEKDKQKVLAEFIGSVFSDLKHERVLILYGTGRNGKRVF